MDLRKSSLNAISMKGRRASMLEPIDPTELQKTLYKETLNNENRSKGTEEKGAYNSSKIEVGIEYKNRKLQVTILRCQDLKPKRLDSSDPYCRCTLMPDKIIKQTKTIRGTVNPMFDETFEYEIERHCLENYYLVIDVFDYDKLSKNESFGFAKIPLNASLNEIRKTFIKIIKPHENNIEEPDRGDLMFSLSYLSGAERLTIVIMKARNLNLIGVGNKKSYPDPFVKVCLLTKELKRIKKKKTTTIKGSINPVYDEEIIFTNITRDQLKELDIKISIIHDSLANREILGNVLLGSSSKKIEYEHWKDMIDGKKSTGWWHQLKCDDKIISDYHQNPSTDDNEDSVTQNNNGTIKKLGIASLVLTPNL